MFVEASRKSPYPIQSTISMMPWHAMALLLSALQVRPWGSDGFGEL